MKILSWNVNGLRAVAKKGFTEWLTGCGAEIVCLQEIKVAENQLSEELLRPAGYLAYFHSAEKPGYSGVAVYTKIRPSGVDKVFGYELFDREGRLLCLHFPGFILLIFYMPHGTRDKSKLGYKLLVYKHLFEYLKKLKGKKVVLVGDLNIAHKEIDLARPEGNKNNIMFTSEERAMLDRLVELGYVDAFREFHEEGGHYTWLSYFKGARERGLGWRIDYIWVSANLRRCLKDAFILSDIQLGSDHCPTGVEIELSSKPSSSVVRR